MIVANFKAEINLTEQELARSREIEGRLTNLVHSVYGKLECAFGSHDLEIKQINKQLREILSLRQLNNKSI